MKSRWVRAVVGIADQGASSLTNALLTILVARSATSEDFGAFALLYALLTVGMGLASTANAEAFVLTHVKPNSTIATLPMRQLLGTNAAIGFATSATIALVGTLLSIDAMVTLALALAAPLVLTQDGYRMLAFATQGPWRALILDGIWLAVFIVAALLAPPASAIWAWMGGAAASLTAAGVVFRLLPTARGLRIYLRTTRAYRGPLVADFAIGAGAGQAVTYIAALSLGFLGPAVLRVATTVSGPLAVLNTAGRLLMTPRLASDSGRRLRTAIAGSVALATLGTGYALVALFTLEAYGTSLFGTTWVDSKGTSLVVTVAAIVGLLAVGPNVWLRVSGRASVVVRWRAAQAICVVGLALLLPYATGLIGPAVAIAVGGVVFTIGLSISAYRTAPPA